jgi:hypothetical protein
MTEGLLDPVEAAHFPVNFGFRFSMNAATPSR